MRNPKLILTAMLAAVAALTMSVAVASQTKPAQDCCAAQAACCQTHEACCG